MATLSAELATRLNNGRTILDLTMCDYVSMGLAELSIHALFDKESLLWGPFTDGNAPCNFQ